MADMATSFYSNLYASENTVGIEEVLSHIPSKVDAAMNTILTAEYSKAEIKTALFQMFPTKAPGPDGFPAHFFPRHWELCGDEVTAMVLRVLNGEDSPEEINKTFIVLIPKIASPKNLAQFRPISLCNVIFKIASKVLANQLKLILPDIISEEQSTFVP
uniref:Reverse transcriptase domain-containing protein n=1 Tax=Triticum urartu TaxID=4572 RepID=A0A8R7TNZ9_TRIUA